MHQGWAVVATLMVAQGAAYLSVLRNSCSREWKTSGSTVLVAASGALTALLWAAGLTLLPLLSICFALTVTPVALRSLRVWMLCLVSGRTGLDSRLRPAAYAALAACIVAAATAASASVSSLHMRGSLAAAARHATAGRAAPIQAGLAGLAAVSLLAQLSRAAARVPATWAVCAAATQAWFLAAARTCAVCTTARVDGRLAGDVALACAAAGASALAAAGLLARLAGARPPPPDPPPGPLHASLRRVGLHAVVVLPVAAYGALSLDEASALGEEATVALLAAGLPATLMLLWAFEWVSAAYRRRLQGGQEVAARPSPPSGWEAPPAYTETTLSPPPPAYQ